MTWRNAKQYAEKLKLLSDDQLPAFRDYVREFGAWDDDEVDAWDDVECNALFIQLVAGDAREYFDAGDAGELVKFLENLGGRFFESDSGEFFYYVGT